MSSQRPPDSQYPDPEADLDPNSPQNKIANERMQTGRSKTTRRRRADSILSSNTAANPAPSFNFPTGASGGILNNIVPIGQMPGKPGALAGAAAPLDTWQWPHEFHRRVDSSTSGGQEDLVLAEEELGPFDEDWGFADDEE